MSVYSNFFVMFILVMVACQIAWGNPIPIGEPYITMTTEEMSIEILPDYTVDMTGVYTFELICVGDECDNPPWRYAMFFPAPPDATDISVSKDGEQIPWEWTAEEYETTIDDLVRNAPPELQEWRMFLWYVDLNPGKFAITVNYKHSLIKLKDLWVLVYSLGTGRYAEGWTPPIPGLPSGKPWVDVTIDVTYPSSFNLKGYSALGEYECPHDGGTTTFSWKAWQIEPMHDFIALFRDMSIEDKVIYVDDDASGAEYGSSWEDAYKSVNDALFSPAVSGDKILVACGTYNETIKMREGVDVYGGYTTSEHTADAQMVGGSILDASGLPTPNHVVIGANNTTISSFIMSGGNANDNDYDWSRESCGGGMWNYQKSPTVLNCIFANNSAYAKGGGMYNYESSPTVINCTFTGNSAGSDGGGMYNDKSAPTITNCIFWDDTGNKEIYDSSSEPLVTYSDVQGRYEGEGNIDADPMFVDPDNGDYHLRDNSPCIRAGIMTPDVPDTDIEGNPRPNPRDSNPDIGAYENFRAFPRVSEYQYADDFSSRKAEADSYNHSPFWEPDGIFGDGFLSYGEEWFFPQPVLRFNEGFWLDSTAFIAYRFPIAPLEGIVESGSIEYDIVSFDGFEPGLSRYSSIDGEAWSLISTDLRIGHYVHPVQAGGTATYIKFIGRGVEIDNLRVVLNIVNATHYGDVSADGKVTAYDAVMALQASVGLIHLTVEQKERADVNGDGNVTPFDAALILQYTVGLIISFPVHSEAIAPALNPKTETKLLTEAIKQLDTTPLTKEQKQVLEQLKSLISKQLLPKHTALLQNYPNPFNPSTWLPYQLTTDAPVTISIYNTKGQLVRKLHLGNQSAGIYMTKDKAACWDGRDRFGEKMASGVYYYTLQAGEFRATRKMVIMK